MREAVDRAGGADGAGDRDVTGPGNGNGNGGGGGGGARRGRPRDASVERTVVEAVLRLIEEGVSVDGLSIERIARTAGVGKATIYRRWSGRDPLLLDVMRSLDDPPPPPAGHSVRDDLVALLEFIRRRGLAKRGSAVMRTAAAQFQSRPDLWDQYHEVMVRNRREALQRILRRGTETGEVRRDVDLDLLTDLFAGPMLSRTMLHRWTPLEEGLSERIVDTVLEGVRPRE
ncbi:hypothetical protein GCM10010406_54550 [Streptomyces thermolineatus]|uniref:HTH tetR-type domain-containing protein n=1 Tax=Streptomyces thermolineatus TaxID=44033 RepID=A0ABN3MYQ0_9ACTN